MGGTIRLLAALMIAMMALSGCTSEPESQAAAPTNDVVVDESPVEEDTTSTTSTQSQPPTTTNDTVEEEPNTAPVAALSADTVSGEAPVEVTFTLEAEDAEGDALTWTFDADGDQVADFEGEGDELPYTATWTYEEANNNTASFIVNDGELEHVATLELSITAVPAPSTFDWSCTVDVPAVVLGISGLPVNYGGCELGTFAQDGVLVSQESASGCREVYETEGASPGTVTLGTAEEGEVYPAGTVFGGRCDLVDGGLPDSTITGTFTYEV